MVTWSISQQIICSLPIKEDAPTEQKQTTTFSEKLEQLNQRIQYTDNKINKLVYWIYGLMDEEKGIVGERVT